MAQQESSTYKQGHSDQTLSTQVQRRAESEAAFLLSHLKKTDYILDIGCGPGTITTGFAKYVSDGAVVGVDLSTGVIEKAKALAAAAHVPAEGPGSVTFQQGDVLERLPFPDDTFDVVFSCQLFPHLPPPDLNKQAAAEMRRVLKPGGIFAANAGVESRFYPRHTDLDRLWAGNSARVFRGNAPSHLDTGGAALPAVLRSVGFDAGGGKVQVSASTGVFYGKETLQWLKARSFAQLAPGDPVYKSWLGAGITEAEIQETRQAVEKWANTDDAWHLQVSANILAWK